MKLPVVVVGCAVAMAGAYAFAVKAHIIKPIDWLAAMHLKARDRLFHGVAVNTAIEDRRDPYWKMAYAEALKQPALLASKPELELYPGRIERGSTDLKEIALTFDDGPHETTAHQLVQELKSLNLRATFFEVGKMAEKHPELVREEAAAGNEIANHSFSHVNLSKIPETEVYTEYRACNLLLKKILGYQPRFCRPPGGNSDPRVFQAAALNGLSTVLWTNDPSDYANPGEDVILERSLKHLNDGGILLLHEGVRETMSLLPLLTKEIRDRGYKIVTVGELVRDSAVAHQSAVVQLKRRLIVRPLTGSGSD
jgi:peptidoglycan/xylan/chitin deacetylase (PgdA/CDA1 family)